MHGDQYDKRPSRADTQTQSVFQTLSKQYTNKNRGGTSDATTPSSLIVPLLMMSFDAKTAIFVFRKQRPTEYGPTDGRTRPLTEIQSHLKTEKKLEEKLLPLT